MLHALSLHVCADQPTNITLLPSRSAVRTYDKDQANVLCANSPRDTMGELSTIVFVLQPTWTQAIPWSCSTNDRCPMGARICKCDISVIGRNHGYCVDAADRFWYYLSRTPTRTKQTVPWLYPSKLYDRLLNSLFAFFIRGILCSRFLNYENKRKAGSSLHVPYIYIPWLYLQWPNVWSRMRWRDHCWEHQDNCLGMWVNGYATYRWSKSVWNVKPSYLP